MLADGKFQSYAVIRQINDKCDEEERSSAIRRAIEENWTSMHVGQPNTLDFTVPYLTDEKCVREETILLDAYAWAQLLAARTLLDNY